MKIEWDNVRQDFRRLRDWYLMLRDAYIAEIQTAYTQVPTDLLPRMTKLKEDNPMDGLNEISAFILYTLHSNASYTLTPGWAPLNEDIAGYFQVYDGSEKEFATVCSKEITIVSAEEIRRLQSIVCEAAYGSGVPDMEKEEYVRSIYFRTGRWIYKRLTWNRRLLFRYWKMFG